MKKVIAMILTIVMLAAFPMSCFAAEEQKVSANCTYTYFDDGSYLVTTFSVEGLDNASRVDRLTKSGSYTVTASRMSELYNADHEKCWDVTLYGSFYVTDTTTLSGICQNAWMEHTIYDSTWHYSDENVRAITNNACGDCVFKCKVLLITIRTIDVSLWMSCDTHGNVT